jgi:NTP pyrophosphatase (non-canonical NTP hydrolase)
MGLERFGDHPRFAKFSDYEYAVENYVPNAKGGGLAWPRNLELGAMGLAGESGEYVDIVKKMLFHDHGLDTVKMALELGDILWYLAYSAHALNLTLSQIADLNIEKLKRRYPDGFSAERSINRA